MVIGNAWTEDIEDAEFRIARFSRRRGYSAQVKEWKERKEKIERKLLKLKARFENALGGNCNICFDRLSGPVLVPCCQNIFCGKKLMLKVFQ